MRRRPSRVLTGVRALNGQTPSISYNHRIMARAPSGARFFGTLGRRRGMRSVCSGRLGSAVRCGMLTLCVRTFRCARTDFDRPREHAMGRTVVASAKGER